MLAELLELFDLIDNFVWGYIGVPALISLGLYFSFCSQWFQIRSLPTIIKNFFSYTNVYNKKERGVNPLHVFFASIGGSVGIGNIVGVCTAVQVGGPGAVFWIWVAGLVGMLVKYAEIYLGITYRVKNKENSYDGGPMIYLSRAFHNRWITRIFAILLCCTGVEIFLFSTMTHSIATTWKLYEPCIVVFLLVSVLFVGKGGIQRVGAISSALIPFFLLVFGFMSVWILALNITVLPRIFVSIFSSAFTGHAAIGSFAGSTVMMTLSQGVRRAVYTGDLGVGFASVIHSESREAIAEKQASLGIFGILLDTFVICSMSLLLILVTDLWHEPIHASNIVAVAFAQYFAYVEVVWPFFLFLLGYTSLIAFFSAGRKAAQFLWPKYGTHVYYVYAVFAFSFFSYIGQPHHSLTIMSITTMLMMFINLLGMIKLRKAIKFSTHKL